MQKAGVPRIDSVSGCEPDPDDNDGTAQCPTEGGVQLWIQGENLMDMVVVIEELYEYIC